MPSQISSPLELYRKVLTEEFIRELQFLLDVSSGRAQAKADFTQKLTSLFHLTVGNVLSELPGGEWLAHALEYALDWGNALRKQSKNAQAECQGHQLEMMQLKIVLDAVAMEAARRHQFFITEYLSDDPLAGVIPFAKTGVERMLEYVLRHRLNLQEEQLLTGLMKGRSGRYASGYTNTGLTLKVTDARKKKKHTAEGAYARSGLRDTSGGLYQIDKQTNLLNKTKDPKYAYTLLPQATIKAEGAIIQPQNVLSETLKTKLSNHQPLWVTITKEDISNYLKAIDPESHDNPSLLSFMSEKTSHRIERLFYVGETQADWDLTDFNFAGADLSDAVFNHCIFGGSLDNTQFNNSYLRQADFTKVTSAKHASFKNAHLEFLRANDINFTASNFTQAHCEYANLESANLEQCQTLGTLWAFAKLDDIKLDNPTDLADIKAAQAEQRNVTQALAATVSDQQKQIEQLQASLKQLADNINKRSTASTTEDSDSEAEVDADETENTLKSLQDLNAGLIQEQQARLAFERHCQGRLDELSKTSASTQQTQAEQAAEITQLKDSLDALKSQDEAFKTLTDKLASQLSETNKQVDNNTLDIAELKTQISSSEAAVNKTLANQAEALAKLSGRVDVLETQQAKTDVKLQETDERLRHIESKLGTQAATKLRDTTEKVKQAIKTRYAADNKIEGVFGKPLSMDEQGGYVNLQMIFTGKIEKKKEEGGKKEGRKSDKHQRDERISSFEDLFGEKRVLALTDVFKPAKDMLKTDDGDTLRLDNEDPNVAPQLLFIQGRAGIGKSTCVRYSANQWSAGNLWSEVDWLFVLTFRGLRAPSFIKAQDEGEQLPMWEWVYRNSSLKQGNTNTGSLSFQAQGVKKADFEIFWENLVQTQPEKIAFILDGLDEAPTEHPCQGALHTLLNDESYAKCKVIITSRPGTDGLLPQNRRNVEVVGLTNDNVEKYIEHFFIDAEAQASDEPPSKAMVQTLKNQPTLWGMAHIPVTLNLMCGLFEEGKANLSDLRSMSGVYYQMESKLLILAAKRETPTLKAQGKKTIDQYTKNQQERYARDTYQLHRQVLSQLALRGIQTEQIILPIEWLDKAIDEAIEQGSLSADESQTFKEALLNIGFVKYTSNDEETETNSGHLEFMHLTFQEYYAAVAVSNTLQEDVDSPSAPSNTPTDVGQFIDEALLNPQYQVLFWLVMGLLKEKPQALSQLFERLIDETSPNRDFIGEYRLGLLARGVEEVLPAINAEEKYQPTPLPGIAEATQKKLFTALITRLNEWRAAYTANRCYFIAPEASTFLQMLTLSPTLSTHLSLMPNNDVLSKLKSRNPVDRRRACYFIGDAKYVTPNILQLLPARLRDKDEDVRQAAAWTIGDLGPAAAATPDILASLADTLCDKDKEVRWHALEAIERLGTAAATLKILAGLAGALRDEEKDVRQAALEAIGKLGTAATKPILAGVLGALRDEEKDVRRTAAEAIANLGPATATPDILADLADALRDENNDVRRTAAEAIANLGTAATTPDILAGVLGALRDEEVRYKALYALEKLGAAAATPDISAGLADALRDEEKDVRQAALEAIGKLGTAATTPDILAGVLGALRDEDYGLRYTASDTIDKLGPTAATPEFLASLSNALHDKDEEVRYTALWTIEKLGPAAATPEILAELLLTGLRDGEHFVHQATAHAIGKLGPVTATPEFLTGVAGALRDESKWVREAAARTIGNLGPAAATREILPGLANALRDEEQGVRDEALHATEKLGPAAATPEFLAGLASTLCDKNEDVRSMALYAISNLGPAATTPEFLAHLADALRDKNMTYAAHGSIEKLGPAAATPEILTALADVLRDKDMCYTASYTIEKLGPTAATPEFLTALLSALRDEDYDVREAALNLIDNLGPAAATPEFLAGLASTLYDKNEGVRSAVLCTIEKLGAAAATPDILPELLSASRDKDEEVCEAAAEAVGALKNLTVTPAYLNIITQQFKEQAGIFHLFIMLYAALHQNASISVNYTNDTTEPDKPYTLSIILAKQHLELALTVEQAQWLRHTIPQGIQYLLDKPFDKASESFMKLCRKPLPRINQDPLMQDCLSSAELAGADSATQKRNPSVTRRLSGIGLFSNRKQSISGAFANTDNIFCRLHGYLASKTSGDDKGRVSDFQTLLRTLHATCNQTHVKSWMTKTASHRHHGPFKNERYHQLRQTLEKQSDTGLQTAFKAYSNYLRTGVFQGQKLAATDPTEMLRLRVATCVLEKTEVSAEAAANSTVFSP